MWSMSSQPSKTSRHRVVGWRQRCCGSPVRGRNSLEMPAVGIPPPQRECAERSILSPTRECFQKTCPGPIGAAGVPGHAGEWSQAVPLCSMDGYVTMGSVDVRLRGSTVRELAGYPHMKVRGVPLSRSSAHPRYELRGRRLPSLAPS